mmetsp:Transcript_3558/g.10570  ORF Transcript_3558/g.10570 Transcript_3558/m.10570 type:complete len:236 (+) Transcript_3558:1473-2180(+)
MYGTFSARPRGQAGQARHAKRLGQAGVLALILAGFALAAVGVNSGLVSTETELMAIYPMGPNESPREDLEKAGVLKAPDGSPHEVLGPYIGRERRPWRAATRTDHRARPRPGSFVSRQVAHEAVGLAEVGTWRPSPDQREGPAGYPHRHELHYPRHRGDTRDLLRDVEYPRKIRRLSHAHPRTSSPPGSLRPDGSGPHDDRWPGRHHQRRRGVLPDAADDQDGEPRDRRERHGGG